MNWLGTDSGLKFQVSNHVKKKKKKSGENFQWEWQSKEFNWF